MSLPLAERTVQAVRVAINESFRRYWCCDDIAWQNDPFDPADLDEFVRFSIVHVAGASGPAGIESGAVKRFRRGGLVTVQVFTRGNSGLARSDELVEKALLFFEAEEPVAGAWYRDPSPAEAPGDGVWRQVNVTAALTYETLRA